MPAALFSKLFDDYHERTLRAPETVPAKGRTHDINASKPIHVCAPNVPSHKLETRCISVHE